MTNGAALKKFKFGELLWKKVQKGLFFQNFSFLIDQVEKIQKIQKIKKVPIMFLSDKTCAASTNTLCLGVTRPQTISIAEHINSSGFEMHFSELGPVGRPQIILAGKRNS